MHKGAAGDACNVSGWAREDEFGKKRRGGGRNHAVMNPGVGGAGLVAGETWDPIAEPRRRIAEGTGQRDGRRREGNDREEIAGGDGSGGGESAEASS